MVDTVDRGPYYKMIDRQALARQQQTGESYEKAFTECYTAPENIAIRDMAQYEHLAKSHDVMFGTGLSSIPEQKAPPYDPLRKQAELAEHLGPAHARLHSMAVDHQRAHSGMSYQQAYSYLYGKMENAPLREKIKSEHMRATMPAHAEGELGKAAPMDAVQDDVDGARPTLPCVYVAGARGRGEQRWPQRCKAKGMGGRLMVRRSKGHARVCHRGRARGLS
jgi:hypothetical protein